MFKHIRNIVFIFIGMVAAGYLALVCVYALPTEPIQKNVAEAANIMQMDGSHPELVYGHQDTMLDNLTDSIMLLMARYEGTESVFEEALLNNRVMVNGMMDSEVLAEEASGKVLEGEVTSYGRYWHGYLLYVKPLLLMLNYGQIRYLIGGIQLTLLTAVLYLFIKKNKEEHIVPFMAAYLFLNPATLTLSLQYFPASVLTMIQFVVILVNEEKYKRNYLRWIYHFFIVGCSIAYFDFLTFPLLTLGMPLVFLLAENSTSLRDDLRVFVGSCVSWGIGYGAMWGSKWILGSLFTKENIIADALGSVLLRIGASEMESQVNAVEVVFKNITANKMGLIFFVIILISVFARGMLRLHTMYFKNLNIGVVFCVILPFVWYIVISNHSHIHYWFTYRILAVSIYAIVISGVKLFNKK